MGFGVSTCFCWAWELVVFHYSARSDLKKMLILVELASCLPPALYDLACWGVSHRQRVVLGSFSHAWCHKSS